MDFVARLRAIVAIRRLIAGRVVNLVMVTNVARLLAVAPPKLVVLHLIMLCVRLDNAARHLATVVLPRLIVLILIVYINMAPATPIQHLRGLQLSTILVHCWDRFPILKTFMTVPRRVSWL